MWTLLLLGSNTTARSQLLVLEGFLGTKSSGVDVKSGDFGCGAVICRTGSTQEAEEKIEKEKTLYLGCGRERVGNVSTCIMDDSTRM
jgi:hypothetical protein